MAALGAMIADGSLIRAFGITLQPLVLGLAISAILGIAVGVAMGLSGKVEWLGSPIFIIMQAAPLAALIPLIVFAYGIGLTAKMLVVVHHGDAGDRAELLQRGAAHAGLADRDGPLLPRPRRAS